MIIDLTDKIKYDTDKEFQEQEFETQEYLYNIMNTRQAVIEYDEFNRPVIEKWAVVKGYDLVRTSVYQKQEADWHLQSQTIEVKEVENE